MNTLAVDPRPPLTLYAGTNKGVYRGRPPSGNVKKTAMARWVWTLYSDGMPRADVRDLELHPRVALMFAATYGRGAYELFLSGSGRAPK